MKKFICLIYTIILVGVFAFASCTFDASDSSSSTYWGSNSSNSSSSVFDINDPYTWEEFGDVVRGSVLEDLGKIDFVANGRDVSIRFLPDCRIYNLKLQITLLDSKGTVLERKTHFIDAMKEYEQYVYNFKIEENSFNNGKTISRAEYEIISGTTFFYWQ